ncbi:signal peptidase I [Candidatus Saccharibacteria bacterium]|nr:signal peptidase I [Candidatus Saccharibacteria bacterium]
MLPEDKPVASPALPPKAKSWRDKWRQKDWRSMSSTIGLLLLAPLIAWLISAFALQSYQVDGQSMETTLSNGDRLIVDKVPRTWSRITNHAYIPQRGDIMIFNAPVTIGGFGGQKQLIKRVIGLPGERVVIKRGAVTVYNQASPKGFNPDRSDSYQITSSRTTGDVDIKLDNDEVFMLGDNRANSEDSRFFGPVPVKDIVGKLALRILPLSKVDKF